MPKEKRPPEGYATGRTRKRMESILGEWYGDNGDGELMKYLPESQHIGNILDRVTKKKLPYGAGGLRTVSDRWSEIAGEVAARHTRPLSFSGKTLFIEVEHPAYLASVRTKAVQTAILARLADILGPDQCTTLTFTPAGRRSRT